MEPHYLRDGSAATAFAALLGAAGYAYGGVFPNYPFRAAEFRDVDPVDWGAPGHEKLRASDLLLITTRPPLDDGARDRPRIKRSGTTLEGRVLEALRQYFVHCSKKRVTVAGVTDECGSYEFTARHPSDIIGRPGKTAAYLLVLPPTTNGGGEPTPRIVCAFGMAGTETMLWSDWLVRSEPSLVLRQGVVIAEMTAPRDDSVRRTLDPDFRRFGNRWSVEIRWSRKLCDR